MGSQVGYGHSDAAAAAPFDYYDITTATLTETFQMQSGKLVLDGTEVTSGTITVYLPLNPVDGATAEIVATGGLSGTLAVQVASTDQVCAKTGASGIKGSAATSLSALTAIKYVFTWFGDIFTQSPANVPPGVAQSQTAAQVGTNPSLALPQGASVGTNAGYWIRVA
jgi:hypothetical protein